MDIQHYEKVLGLRILNFSTFIRHLYHISDWDGQELKVTAEVGLLTRNIKFYGNVNQHWAEELPLCDETFNPLEGAVQNCFLNKFNDEIGR